MPAVHNGKIIKVLIGQVALTRAPNRLQTVLGSCIGLAVYDQSAHLAGLAHILLPSAGDHPSQSLPGKYADQALACLIAGLCEYGAKRDRLQAKMAGGAQMFATAIAYQDHDVGARNIDAVRALLAQARIPLLADDVGGTTGRRVEFDPEHGRLSIDDFTACTKVI